MLSLNAELCESVAPSNHRHERQSRASFSSRHPHSIPYQILPPARG